MVNPCNMQGLPRHIGSHLAKDAPVFIPLVELLQRATELGEVQSAAKLMFEGLLDFFLWEDIGAMHHYTPDDRIGSCLQMLAKYLYRIPHQLHLYGYGAAAWPQEHVTVKGLVCITKLSALTSRVSLMPSRVSSATGVSCWKYPASKTLWISSRT